MNQSRRESISDSASKQKKDKKDIKKDKRKDIADDYDDVDALMGSSSSKDSILPADSEATEDLIVDLTEKLSELRDKIRPLKELAEEFCSSEDLNEDLLDYLVVKEQILTSYCTCITFYIYMKSRGLSVGDHPVIAQLLHLRYALEKMRPIDTKLKYQIDRLVQLNSLSAEDVKISTLKPRIGALADSDDSDDDDDANDNDDDDDDDDDNDDDNDDDDDDDDDDDEIVDDSSIEDDMDTKNASKYKSMGGKSSKKEHSTVAFANNKKSRSISDKIVESSNSVYKAPKLSAVPYNNDKSIEKTEEKLKRKMKNIKNSAIFESINEEFGITPESVSSSGIAHLSNTKKEIDDLVKERARGEEDRFIRTVQSRKDKKQLNKLRAKANDFDNLDELGDFGDFSGLDAVMKMSSKLSSNSDRKICKRSGSIVDYSKDSDDHSRSSSKSTSAASALLNTVAAFSSENSKKRPSDSGSYSSRNIKSKSDGSGSSTTSNLEKFTSNKRKTLSQKR